MERSPVPIGQLPYGDTQQPSDLIPVSRPNSPYYMNGQLITTYSVNPALERARLTASNTLAKGSAVYVTADGTYALAIANDLVKSKVVGFAHDNYDIGQPVYLDTQITIPTSTVTPGTVYYLSATTLGGITSTPPVGAYAMQVGIGNASDPQSILAIQLGAFPTTTHSAIEHNYLAYEFNNETQVTINHEWGAFPQVQIIDNDGRLNVALFINGTLDSTVVHFTAARSGVVILTT